MKISYIECLQNKILDNDDYKFKPETGGKKLFSIRLNEKVEMQVEKISELSGWTRTEVINAFIHDGLTELHANNQISKHFKQGYKSDDKR